MNDQRILERIKKCLALSQSSEPHEAAAALRQAQKLMEMHGGQPSRSSAGGHRRGQSSLYGLRQQD